MSNYERRMMEIKARARVDKIAVKGVLKDVMDKGEVVDREVVTSVTLQVDCLPGEFDDILRARMAGHAIDLVLASPQAMLDEVMADAPGMRG